MYVCPECRKVFKVKGNNKKVKCSQCSKDIFDIKKINCKNCNDVFLIDTKEEFT